MTGDLVRNIFLYSYVGTPTVMVRRDVFGAVGAFETGLAAAEDDNLWMRIAHRFKVELIDEVLVYVRLRAGSITTSGSKLSDGIDANVALLRSRYPELLERIGRRAVRRKLGVSHLLRAHRHLDENRPREARVHFARSLCLCPRVGTLPYLLVSLLPHEAVVRVRRLRRFLLSMVTRQQTLAREDRSC